MSEAPAQEPVLYEVEGPVARVVINRPQRRNALNPEVLDGISSALSSADADDGVKAVVLTGSGDKAFCAGADLGGMTPDSRVAQHFERAQIADLLVAMRRCALPIVARVNGHALAGGFGLMLACDLIVASRDAEMGTPEINLGLWPFMISALIQRDVPRKIALELMMTGRRMSSEEARSWGFVNRVTDRDALDDAVEELVGALVSKSPVILGLGKRSFYRAQDMALEDGLEYLAGMLTLSLQSEDSVEGVTAFFEKRSAQWKGR